MNPLTHKFLTDKVYLQLNKEFQLVLSKKSLIWGSIRPDFIRHSIPHFKERGVQPFYNKCQKIEQSISKLSIKQMSIELGQIFHYICDYFCHAHNKRKFINKTRLHILNEIKLQRFIQNTNFNFLNVKLNNYNDELFENIIEKEYTKFVNDSFNFKNDLIYSYKVCIIIGRKIMSNIKRMNNIA